MTEKSPEHLPAPLVPAEVDTKGLRNCPFDADDFPDSDFCLRANDAEFRAGVMLRLKAWKRSGRLPNDDLLLARLSGAGPQWEQVKSIALLGWVLCSDGHWYHPELADHVLQAWKRRVEWRDQHNANAERQRRWRQAMRDLTEKARSLGIKVPKGASREALESLIRNATPATASPLAGVTTSVTRNAEVTAREGTGNGKGEGNGDLSETHLAPSLQPDAAPEREPLADVMPIQLNDGSEWQPTQRELDELTALFPAVDVPAQFRSMRAWCMSHPRERKTRSGVMRFVTGWLTREQNKGGQARVERMNGGGQRPMSRQEQAEAANVAAARAFVDRAARRSAEPDFRELDYSQGVQADGRF